MPIGRGVCGALAAAVLGMALSAEALPYGVNVHLGPPRAIDKVAGSGIAWARVDFVWAFVEAAEADFDWRQYDAAVDRLEASGFRIYATLGGTPAWATDGVEFIGVPRDPAAWADFCYRAAARYRGRIAAWGFWNEPNLAHFWQGNRSQYLEQILRPGLAAVAAADPAALRCGPDLAHLTSADWDIWLASVITFAGAELDVVTHHVYPSNGIPSSVIDKLDRDPQYPWEKPSVRRVLQQSGWWGRPVWLTETGRESEPAGDFWQAQFYQLLLHRLFDPGTGLGWIDRVFFYELNDGFDFPAVSWGLLGPPPEYEPKATLAAYAARIAATAIDDAEVVRVDGPSYVPPGGELELRVVLRNTGTTTWAADAGFTLASLELPATWDAPAATLPAGRLVRPGATVAVAATVAIADTTASRSPRRLRWRLARPDGTLFGDPIRHDVRVASLAPPAIGRQPGVVITPLAGNATFTVSAASTTPVSYRWQRNGLDLVPSDRIVGADSAVLTVLGVGPRDTGDYRCVVANDAGPVASAVGRLELLAEVRTGAPPRDGGSRHGPDPGLVAAWLRLRQTAASAVSASAAR